MEGTPTQLAAPRRNPVQIALAVVWAAMLCTLVGVLGYGFWFWQKASVPEEAGFKMVPGATDLRWKHDNAFQDPCIYVRLTIAPGSEEAFLAGTMCAGDTPKRYRVADIASIGDEDERLAMESERRVALLQFRAGSPRSPKWWTPQTATDLEVRQGGNNGHFQAIGLDRSDPQRTVVYVRAGSM